VAKRIRLIGAVVARVEHPAGGFVHIRRLSAEKQIRLDELTSEREMVTDGEGNPLYDRNGQPVMRPARNSHELLEFLATEVVAKLEDIDFVDDEGRIVEPTADLVLEWLLELYEESYVDTKGAARTRRGQTWLWLIREEAKLRTARRELQEAEEKNS
jgi:hypothetical protein